MRYATYQSDEGPRLGLVRDDAIHPLRDVRVLGSVTTSEVILAAPADTRLKPVAMSQAKLLPVSPNPAKIFCVGLNYRSHIGETGRDTPAYPVLDPSGLDISLKLNGAELQRSNTSRMIFDVPGLVEVISEFTELLPGDVILTGTPGGVGFRRDPQIFLNVGDDVEVEISGIGTLRNPVALEPK